MKLLNKSSLYILLLFFFMMLYGCVEVKIEEDAQTSTKKSVKRIGMVIGFNPEMTAEYKRLHADSNAGVRDLLTKYHMHNFSIFMHQIDGKWYEFGYYEYTGDDYEGDMAKIDAEERNIAWLKVCDPMQIPLEGEKSWAIMEQVYYNE
jgi:L-rhamnose mutarotase